MKRFFGVWFLVLILFPVSAQHSVASASGDHRGISVYFEAGKDGGVSGDVRLYDRMIALVVGIDRYLDLPADDQLQYAVRDAKGVAEVLRDRYSFDRIVELYDEDAVKSQIMKVLQGDFSTTGEQDAVLIYFAGHGITRSTAQGDLGYLVPHDGSLRHDQMYKNISMQQIKFDVCPLIPAKHVLIVADACFGGLLLATRAGSMEPSGTMAYLKEITGEQVRQIITAGGKDQAVLDGGPGGHSVFTGRFIQALNSVESYVTAKRLGLDLGKSVHGDAAARGHNQMPQVGEIYGTGDFVFVPDASKRRQKAEDEVKKLEQELESLKALKAGAEQRREKSRLRELERQQLEKKIELENARLREEAARNEAKMEQVAKEAARKDMALQAEREDERQRQLASLKLQAEKIREQLGSSVQAMGMQDTAEEIRRINSLIQKMEDDFDKSLQAQFAPVRKRYASQLARVENIPPRDAMFETEVDYRNRLEKDRKDAEILRAKQSAEEKTIRSNVFALLEKELNDLVRQRKQLTSVKYTLGPKKVVFKLVKYHPDKEYFDLYLYIDKKVHSGTCVIPKLKAKLFYKNPSLLLPEVVLNISEDASVAIKDAKFFGPDNASFPISNLIQGKVVEKDRHFWKLEYGVVVDTRTGLQWYAGPDKSTNWHEADKWVENLTVAEGGWRMPTRDEISGLCEPGRGTRNMTPLLQTTGWRVWSGEKKEPSSAWFYHFNEGRVFWYYLHTSNNHRVFAVRSR